jgi:hypothetical protein
VARITWLFTHPKRGRRGITHTQAMSSDLMLLRDAERKQLGELRSASFNCAMPANVHMPQGVFAEWSEMFYQMFLEHRVVGV